MKKKTLITLFLLLIVILIGLARCMPTRVISGPIQRMKGDMVQVNGFQFRCDTTGLYVGKFVTFTPSVNRSKINSKKLN